jgi:protein TonB
VPAIPEPINDVPVDFVQDVPVFPGCERFNNNEERKVCLQHKLAKFVKKHFDVRLAEEYGLNGKNRIDTQFKVTTTGEVEFMMVRAPHPKLEEEAKRLIEKLPKMQPGRQQDKPVNVIFGLPINFQVQD